MSQWIVVYDADCGLCNWLLAAFLRWDRSERLRPIALQRPKAEELLAELTPAERNASWHLISPTGDRHSGGAALAPLLRLLPAGGALGAVAARFPSLAERGYGWVAGHRTQLSKYIPIAAKRRARERVQARSIDDI